MSHQFTEYGVMIDRRADGLGVFLARVTEDLEVARQIVIREQTMAPNYPVFIRSRFVAMTEWGDVCYYESQWTDEVGEIEVCKTHGNNSKHDGSDGPNRPCLTVDPF
jgi:hypothetical protein